MNLWRQLQNLQSQKTQTQRCQTPTLLQMEAVECGAAALGIILSYYGRIVPLAELRQACGVSRDGVNAFNITKAARNYQLSTKAFKKNLTALRQVKCPYIVYWNFNHFLVVEGFTKERVYLNDPASGRRSVSLEEFSGSYTGVVLIMEPSPEFRPGGRKPSTILGLWSRLRGSIGALIYCVLAGFLQVIPGLAIPAFSQVFVDDILIQHRDEWLRPLILGMLLTAGINGFLSLLQLQFLRHLKIKLSVGTKSRFLWHILRLPVSFYDQRFAGEISNRDQLNDSIANMLSGKLATTVIASASIFLYVIVMLQYDLVLTSIAIAFVAINLITLQWVRKRRVDINVRLIQEYGKVSGVGISGLQSMETLKASALESDFFGRWAGYYTKAINTRQELETTNQILSILPAFLSASASLLLLGIGGLRVMDGVLSIGMLVAFQGMMQRFLDPVANLVSLGSDLQEMEGNLARLDDVLSNPIDPQLEKQESQRHEGVSKLEDLGVTREDKVSPEQGNPLMISSSFSSSSFPKLQGYVELRNITFGYSRVDPPIIENFNLSLKPGQRVALVGGSGSGKSTVAKLLSGLYQPWLGEIFFDGQPRKQISRQVLANSISMVEQEILLFAGSVRDNLTLWDTTIPDSNLVRACQDAVLDDLIVSLPGGYNADLLEGATNLSGGQRQRLEIARALVNNPSILIMDEATSALDTETERIVSRNLCLRGCTCIIVAHRLSTIRDCDEIIVLDRGKIVQRGTHKELQHLQGPYLELIRSEAEITDKSSGVRPSDNFVSVSAASPSLPTKTLGNTIPNLPGKRCCFQPNESLLLDQPDTIWLVKSGCLASFAIARGTRRYLFSSTSGQAMFVFAPRKQQILAIAIEPTELLQVSPTDFYQFAQTNPEVMTLVDSWIEQLSSVLVSITPPSTPSELPETFQFSLAPDEIFQLDKPHIAWVQILQGQAKWMGFAQLPLTSASVILPLDHRIWLQAEDPIELRIFNTSAIKDINIIFDGLSQLQAYFIDCIDLLQRKEIDTELLRFQARERLEQQVMTETLAELSTVTIRKKQESNLHSQFNLSLYAHPHADILIAAGAVGNALGVKIVSPPAFENLKRVKDPIDAIAHASRIRVRRIKLRDNWWQKDCGPMLAYTLNDKLPVAVLPVSDISYELYIPSREARVSVNASVAANLAIYAHVFYRPLPEKPLKTWEIMKFALRGRSKDLTVILLSGTVISLLGMLAPQGTAILIDQAIPNASRGLLIQIAFGLVAAAFGGVLFQLVQGLTMIRLETFADSGLQPAVWDRLLKLKISFFREFSVGDLNSRVTAITQIRQKLGNTVLKTIFSSLFSLLNLGLLFYYSLPLAVFACGVALVNAVITVISGMLIVRKIRPLLDQQGKIFGIVVELINGVAKLRVAKAEVRAFAHWGKKYKYQLKLMLSTQMIEDCLAVINQVLPILTTINLFWLATGLTRSTETSLSTGNFLAFNLAFGTFINGTTSLSGTVVDVLQVLPLWQRAEPILKALPEVNSSQVDPGRLSGRLVVDNLNFRYRDDGALTLDDVSIHAEPGEFIAIVGPSGSGKSTLLRLLLGFEVPASGKIYYDGQDLAGLDIYAVRRQLGVVLQNSRLMSASIFNNIASNALISIDDAWEAARMAGFADDIAAMPMGMHTVVSEGATNLSGGQRQRLLIARALVLKPRILLFDEATSALDNRTQAIVSQSLAQLKVTRIAIAHRLSTIHSANRIYVIQNGKVVQQGNFSELANQSGLFAQLMLRQML